MLCKKKKIHIYEKKPYLLLVHPLKYMFENTWLSPVFFAPTNFKNKSAINVDGTGH